MARPGCSDNDSPGPRGRFADDLIGLDPADPDVQAFAAHLDRMQRTPPAFTVEGSLAGVRYFAEGARTAHGKRRILAVTIVGLLLLGVFIAVWEAVLFLLTVLV